MTNKQQTVQTVFIGLLGLGTVGGGVYKTIERNRETIRVRTGHDVQVARILVRDLEKERDCQADCALLTLDAADVLDDARISVCVEVMGGIEPARSLIEQALRSGRHVITANKELMARHGAELLALAAEHDVHLLFEASVAGGIPVIRLLQGYLTANRVSEIQGILNGTCNYILTQMRETGREYEEIVIEAQQLGYAEADPTADVEGFDAASKLAILTNLAYEAHVDVTRIERQGITQLRAADLRLADQLGYAVKLIGAVREAATGVHLSVRPRLLPKHHPLAGVDDVFNAVTIHADVVGELTFIGRGAGELPTASAVTEDLTALLAGADALRRPSWTRTLQLALEDDGTTGGAGLTSGSASVATGGAGLATGGASVAAGSAGDALYLALTAASEAELVPLVDGVEAAFRQAGIRVVERQLAVDGGGRRQAWLLLGAREQGVHAALAQAAQTGNFAANALLLPVEGPVATGVEWDVESYPRAL